MREPRRTAQPLRPATLRKRVGMLLAGFLVASTAATGMSPVAAQQTEPTQLDLSVNILNNNDGTLEAQDVEVWVDGTLWPINHTYSTADPALADQYAGDTGHDVDVAELSGEIAVGQALDVVVRAPGYRVYSRCDDAELDEGSVLSLPAAENGQNSCRILLDDIGRPGRLSLTAPAFEPQYFLGVPSPGLVVEGLSGLGTDWRLWSGGTLDLYPSLAWGQMRPTPLLGATISLQCEGGPKGLGDDFDNFTDLNTSGKYRKVTDTNTDCDLTYSQEPFTPSDTIVRVKKSVANIAGGSATIDDFDVRVNEVPRDDGEVLTFPASDIGTWAHLRVLIGSSTIDGYESFVHCYPTNSPIDLQFPVDDFIDWGGSDLPYGLNNALADDFTCEGTLLELSSDNFTAEVVVLNNDGGSLQALDVPINLDGVPLDLLGDEYRGTTLTSVPHSRVWSNAPGRHPVSFADPFSSAHVGDSPHTIAVDIPGYRTIIRCGEHLTDSGTAVLPVGVTHCLISLDDIGSSGPSIKTTVRVGNQYGGTMAASEGGMLLDDQPFFGDSVVSVDANLNAHSFRAISVDGYFSSIECHSNVQNISGDDWSHLADVGKSSSHRVIHDAPIACAVSYLQSEPATTTVTVTPEIINDHGGALAVAPVRLDGEQFSGTIDVAAGSTHTIRASAVTGYIKGPLTCTDQYELPVQLSAFSFTARVGQQVVCSVTYNDIPSGIAFATNFTYGNPDARITFGTSTLRHGQFRARPAGTYTVDTKPLNGYTLTNTTCTDTKGNTQTATPGQTITITNGQFLTCTYNYTAKPIRVLFNVNIINDNNGTATTTTPRITFGNITTRHNQFRKLPAGDYDLDMIPLNGYTLTNTTCTDIWGRPVTVTNNTLQATPTLWLTCTYTINDQAQ